VLRTVAEGAIVGGLVGFLLDVRARRRAAITAAAVPIGAKLVGLARSAGPRAVEVTGTIREAADAARPHLATAADIARTHVLEGAEETRPHVVTAADLARTRAVDLTGDTRPHLERAAAAAREAVAS